MFLCIIQCTFFSGIFVAIFLFFPAISASIGWYSQQLIMIGSFLAEITAKYHARVYMEMPGDCYLLYVHNIDFIQTRRNNITDEQMYAYILMANNVIHVIALIIYQNKKVECLRLWLQICVNVTSVLICLNFRLIDYYVKTKNINKNVENM